jgi:hypothetical protein
MRIAKKAQLRIMAVEGYFFFGNIKEMTIYNQPGRVAICMQKNQCSVFSFCPRGESHQAAQVFDSSPDQSNLTQPVLHKKLPGTQTWTAQVIT